MEEGKTKKIIVDKIEQGGEVVFYFRFKTLTQLLDMEDYAPLPEKKLTGARRLRKSCIQ